MANNIIWCVELDWVESIISFLYNNMNASQIYDELDSSTILQVDLLQKTNILLYDLAECC